MPTLLLYSGLCNLYLPLAAGCGTHVRCKVLWQTEVLCRGRRKGAREAAPGAGPAQGVLVAAGRDVVLFGLMFGVIWVRGQGMCVRQSSHKGAEKGRQTHEGKRDSLGSAFPPKTEGRSLTRDFKGRFCPWRAVDPIGLPSHPPGHHHC